MHNAQSEIAADFEDVERSAIDALKRLQRRSGRLQQVWKDAASDPFSFVERARSSGLQRLSDLPGWYEFAIKEPLAGETIVITAREVGIGI